MKKIYTLSMAMMLAALPALAQQRTMTLHAPVAPMGADRLQAPYSATYNAPEAGTVKKVAKADAAPSMTLSYCGEQYTAYGVGCSESGVGIMFPADYLRSFVGNQITAINVAAPISVNISTQTSQKNALTKAKIMLCNEMNGTPVRENDVTLGTTAFEYNELKFTEPYTIEEGKDVYLYVQYEDAHTTGDAITDYIIIVDQASQASDPNAGYLYSKFKEIKNQQIVTQPNAEWKQFAELMGANFCVTATVSGDKLPENIGAPIACEAQQNIKPGEKFDVMVAVLNNGANALQNVEFSMKVGDQQIQTMTANVYSESGASTPVMFGEYGIAVGQFTCEAEGNNIPYQISVSKVNGVENSQADKVAEGYLLCLAEGYPTNVVVEEFTSNTCPYCPIGITGMEQMKAGGVVKDYVKIAYQGSDALYVPATQLDLVSKYIGSGGEDAPVRLNKLGGDQWQKAKARAKAAAKDLAKGLIQLYAARKRLPGFAFAADSPWQKEFEESFEYAETDDQLRAIAEIKHDMESPAPMERLLCGDVGFGKTEVALRAVMKCILDGKQAAILVPTTVLAQQHYLTALKRFGSFPVTIDVLSRFRTATQMKKTLQELESGKIDLIIGTHKLLQKNVHFKDLGLLIVDEEQRFGVSHKERLKEISRGVDVLTLSATPIPRTLNMALSGLRDMSTIEQPPHDRYPVQTFVLEHSDRILDEAIRRELARGGQVYYLHNRVESIDECAAKLKERLGDVEVAVAHGKMNQEQLSDVMQAMSDGQIQILVCTTIIETGIDIPNVNTLIIEDADKLGLAQLHQLRGRVGRSSRHAYAYLTFRRGKVLSEIAEKRLEAIREYAEFGSGFKIAMRDLEIRGAGDLLGSEQSGHMLSVGYDMYLKLLEDAVLEERGEEALKEPECTADLDVTANISKSYVSSGEQRMDLYRRMAAIRTQEDADDLLDEIVDRYGDPPKGVMNLIAIALLRARAAASGIVELNQKGQTLTVKLSVFDFAAISSLCEESSFKGRVFFAAGKTPAITVKLKSGEDALKLAQLLVDRYCLLRNK